MLSGKFIQFFVVASVTLLFAACQDKTETYVSDETNVSKPVETQIARSSFYDEMWYEAEFWPGEYPNGLIVLEPGVTLAARTVDNPNIEPSLECEMDYLSLIHI